MIDIEIWKDIKDYEGLYQVSNWGRVKSLGNGGTHKTSRILKSEKNTRGYLQVQLSKNGKRKWFFIHRLVAEVFLENPENLPQVNHIDEDKTNNRVENLEWCEHKYNMNYGTRNERISKTKINGKKSKKVLQFTLDGEFIREWPSTKEIERQLGFDNSAVCRCCNGKQKSAYGFRWCYK